MAWIRTSCSNRLDVEVEWVSASVNEEDSEIVVVHMMTPSGVLRLN